MNQTPSPLDSLNYIVRMLDDQLGKLRPTEREALAAVAQQHIGVLERELVYANEERQKPQEQE